MLDPHDLVREELESLAERGLLRCLREIDGPQGPRVRVAGRWVANFSSNNYLGFAHHPVLEGAAAAAMREEGFGAGASRLISGNLRAHRALERRVAAWKGTEAALLFNSGYQANLGVLSGLAGPGDAIYSDAWNHASLIDGARLSRADVHVYPHGDVEHLAALLRDGAKYRRRLLVSDSVFSMDGDHADLDRLRALGDEHAAFVIVDEAHAVGVLGPGGAGLAGRRADLSVGTLSKALGGFGAYAAGPRVLVDLLVQRARSFVFSTALPAPVVAFGAAAIDLCAGAEGDALRARLQALAERFHRGLRQLDLSSNGPSHIVPILVGDAHAAMVISDDLLSEGVFAQGIRPPTVPEGTSRLRFSIMATHEDEQIDLALAALTRHRHRLARSAGPGRR